ncbi:MAG: hypothetical protein A3A98_00810 [Candidatus Staskawiczbacteria bacterium RIFCSPLOWO2_01_FULL_40_39]|uniref:Uncharacterized protein n=1 Tax=Candidatus Staskawiczbacteria bacterium RIFCSPHIGHO2_01_FULL_39_25 TaxID=1802202 RepID=A0A1G2HMZ9_9BACT|nr:MAG: hypothetical protein A2730_00810 [Candidatus Staskawiczbacteria bacterium RIFCSPHIGHO2_01_FULL_39_25]OGZ73271.1 MAG: hypothetical protein A3A98_00810 [Candidatus Staskawiczbacteria bacterium RIFCSPLOWO2_01_FULL_40_39]OGZ74757.1 MAG: hypothetical protein A3I87_00690 [Candidatus Staskawiczbacteria bacterium RIFCSPLOWO2_02_FULL_39_8]
MNKLEKVLYIIFFIALTIFFIKFFLLVLLIVLLLGFLRTWQMQQEPNNKAFLNGALPNPTPDGFYQGDVGFNTSWLGKKFDAENSTGINVFKNKRGVQIEKYPFKTYAGRGLADQQLFVLKIDYNVTGNPFWLRPVLDEIVQIAPNEYLGKMHARIIPDFPFSFLYFQLKK